MSGTTSSGSASASGVLSNLTPVTAGGVLEVNNTPALVDASDMTITVGGMTYSANEAVELLSMASGCSQAAITVSGSTTIAIPAIGDAHYVITATADATLQFSGKPASGQAQRITLEILATGYTVALPTTNVQNMAGVPAVASSTRDTLVTYLVRSGSAIIVGGV